jgi:predicted MFS family arabinose efflux permease
MPDPASLVLFCAAALALAVVPGALAVVAALRARPAPEAGRTPAIQRVWIAARRLRHGPLGLTLAGIAVLEAANISFTLLILRATKLLEESRTVDEAVMVAVALFLGYRLAAVIAALAGGRLIDATNAPLALATGSLALLAAYVLFAGTSGGVTVLGLAFVLAGVGLGLAETGEHVAVGQVAAPEARALAFGAVTALQSAGRLFASIAAGVLWTAVAPAAGLLVTAPLLVLCPLVLLLAQRRVR